MEMERDFVTFTDDDGNEFELDVIDYFDFEGDEYAVLMDLASLPEECGCEDEDCDCLPEQDVYIMKVVVNGEMEEFVPAEDDKMDQLAAIVEQRLSEGCCCDDCGDDECCDDDCDCGCHHE